jgi:hypothetical protein
VGIKPPIHLFKNETIREKKLKSGKRKPWNLKPKKHL